jgi:hypothetical protein
MRLPSLPVSLADRSTTNAWLPPSWSASGLQVALIGQIVPLTWLRGRGLNVVRYRHVLSIGSHQPNGDGSAKAPGAPQAAAELEEQRPRAH